MTREDRGTLAITLALSLAAFAIGLVALTRGGAKPFVSPGPDPQRALVQATNARIRESIQAQGFEFVRALVVRNTVDGDTGTVVAEVEYKRAGRDQRAYVTLIFHRTIWQLGQITPSAPPGA